MKTVIEVETFGDYNVKYTVDILIHSDLKKLHWESSITFLMQCLKQTKC